jgi:hypothetical protein
MFAHGMNAKCELNQLLRSQNISTLQDKQSASSKIYNPTIPTTKNIALKQSCKKVRATFSCRVRLNRCKWTLLNKFI